MSSKKTLIIFILFISVFTFAFFIAKDFRLTSSTLRSENTSALINWKTYSNKNYTLIYPESFVVVESKTDKENETGFYDNTETFSQGTSPIITAYVHKLPDGISLKDWIKSLGVSETEITETKIADKLFFQFFESLGEDMEVFCYSMQLNNTHILNMCSPSLEFTKSKEFQNILASLSINNK